MKNQKVTKNKIMSEYKNVIRVGYCELQHLLRFQERKHFTSGAYGWNADIYQVDYNTVIVTGYRPFGNVKADYDLINKYDSEARKIICSNLNYEEQQTKVNELLEKFTQESLQEEA